MLSSTKSVFALCPCCQQGSFFGWPICFSCLSLPDSLWRPPLPCVCDFCRQGSNQDSKISLPCSGSKTSSQIMVHRGRVKQTFVLAIQPQKLIVGVIEFRKQLKQVSLAFLSVSDIIFSLQCLAAFSGAFDRTGNLGGPFGFKCGFAIQAFANAINLFFLWVLFVPLFHVSPNGILTGPIQSRARLCM